MKLINVSEFSLLELIWNFAYWIAESKQIKVVDDSILNQL